MSFIFELYRADGRRLIGLDSFGLVFVDVITLPASGGAIKDYPLFKGRQLHTIGRPAVTITYPDGVPRIATTDAGGAGINKIYVFAK